MQTPPKLSEMPREVSVEVLPPERPQGASSFSAPEGPPIHALSALLLVIIDSLWLLPDMVPALWIVTIPLCFISVAVPVFFIQKFLKKDSTGRALTFALLLGVVGAVPMSVTGTPVGVGLLAWSGLSKLLGRSATK